MFDLPIAEEEEDKDGLSLQEATVELPRSSATKRKPRQIFKSVPKKKTPTPSESKAAPTSVAPWMQQSWLPAASTQQQQ